MRHINQKAKQNKDGDPSLIPQKDCDFPLEVLGAGPQTLIIVHMKGVSNLERMVQASSIAMEVHNADIPFIHLLIHSQLNC